MGYDTPRAMAGLGSTFPANIFSDFMSDIKANKECGDFEKPSTTTIRVCSNGKYKGKDLDIEYKKGKDRWYYVRQDGMDWYSKQNQDTLKTKQYEIENNKNIERAKLVLEAFEKFYITSIEEAIALDDKYQEVIGVIEAIDDAYESSNFMKRAVKHYDLLNDDVIKNWNKYKEEYYADSEKQAEADAKVAAEDSKLEALRLLKENRLARADWYLGKLRARKYNTDTTQLLVADAASIIDRLKDYKEYDDYKAKYDEQVSRINSLPTEIPVLKVPRDNVDSQPIQNNNYPEDPDNIIEYVDPEPTEEPESSSGSDDEEDEDDEDDKDKSSSSSSSSKKKDDKEDDNKAKNKTKVEADGNSNTKSGSSVDNEDSDD